MPALTLKELTEMGGLNCSIFVETGTYLGETTNMAMQHFEKVHTIEIKEDLYTRAKHTFSKKYNVVCYLGDSSIVLVDICKTLDKATCFWLDGHYSAGGTGKGTKNIPLYEELEIIMKECKQSCLILIDDCRLFEKVDPYVDGWDQINTNSILKIVSSRMLSNSFYPSILDKNDRLIIQLKSLF
jgi:hypothetical protein